MAYFDNEKFPIVSAFHALTKTERATVVAACKRGGHDVAILILNWLKPEDPPRKSASCEE